MPYSNITITTDSGLSFVAGQFIQVINDASNYINAQVVSYNPSTGELVFTPISYAGTGTYDTWSVVASGASGSSGTSGMGADGTAGTSGVSGDAFATTSTNSLNLAALTTPITIGTGLAYTYAQTYTYT